MAAEPRLRHTGPMRLRTWQEWLLATGFWLLFGVVSGAQIWLSMYDHGHSFARVVFCQVMVWSAWVLFTFAIAALVRRAPIRLSRPDHLFLHLLVALAFSMVHAVWWVGLELWLVPYDVMNPTGFDPRLIVIVVCQLPLTVLLYALVVLAIHSIDTQRKYRERELIAAQLETSLAEARLVALEVQLQPHFLFNTLNAISALVRTGEQTAAIGMIAGLSDLLRYALERAGTTRVSLDEEIGMLRRYLEIQRLRFGERLSFDIDVAPDARRAAVPVLLLQPLAENAIRHGIERHEAAGRITVRAHRAGDTLRLEMFNTGRLSARVEPGIGLTNTLARLEQLYGERHRFDLAETEGGVTTVLTIPWSEAK